jgi:hypothetical protein
MLSALGRLPRPWTLLYILNQHGISLNTLYARCEPQGPTTGHTRGTLVVINDAGDVVFGAWVVEGVIMGVGSRESFWLLFLFLFFGRLGFVLITICLGFCGDR